MIHYQNKEKPGWLLPSSWLVKEDRTADYYAVLSEQLEEIVQTLLALESRLVWIFSSVAPDNQGKMLVWYVFELIDTKKFTVLVLDSNNLPSIVPYYPAASRFERAVSDGFGIRFFNSPDERRLFLHEWYPEGFHPLQKTCENQPVIVTDHEGSYPFREMSGKGVYQVPVGPVHAGIIEPGHFRFSVIGETILNLEVRLGYLHRGIEKRAEGESTDFGVCIAETISGDESVSNACCFAMAVETIGSVQVPFRAQYLRAILLELERSYSLLSDLAGMVTDVAFAAAAHKFLIIREELQRVCERLTGSRFLKGIICIGGIAHDITGDALIDLKKTAGKAREDLERTISWTVSVPSVIDRFSTTGVVCEPLVDPLALSGPVARASGRPLDVRVDHPYGIYETHLPTLVTRMSGDVLARFTLKGDEIMASLSYIEQLIADIPDGEVRTGSEIKDGYALAAVESPRGRALFFVLVRNDKIMRMAVSTASFCNWVALEHAVIGDIVPDFPVINKSMNLSYAGTDL